MIYKDVENWSRVEIAKFLKGFLYEPRYAWGGFAVNSQIHIFEIRYGIFFLFCFPT